MTAKEWSESKLAIVDERLSPMTNINNVLAAIGYEAWFNWMDDGSGTSHEAVVRLIKR